jgi:hypothetical protein
MSSDALELAQLNNSLISRPKAKQRRGSSDKEDEDESGGKSTDEVETKKKLPPGAVSLFGGADVSKSPRVCS